MDTKGKENRIKVEQYLSDHKIDVTKIVDFEAFEKYIDYMNKPLLKDKVKICSDERQVNVGMPIKWFKQKIEGLPEEEQKKMLLLKKIYSKVAGKANHQKKLAFGTHFDVRRAHSEGHFKIDAVDRVNILSSRKIEILELFGRCFTVKEIHEIIVTEFHLPCNIGTVFNFRKTYIDIITEKQEAWKEKQPETRFAYKKARVEELHDIYGVTKRKWAKANYSRLEGMFMTNILKQIKEEMEGDLVMNINGNIGIQIEQSMLVHAQKELMQKSLLTSLVIARVAMKAGKDPTYFLKKLGESYYAKFTALNGEPLPAKGIQPELPSKEAYNFDSIGKRNKAKEELEFTEFTELNDKEQEKAKTIEDNGIDFKKQLLAKLSVESVKIKADKRKVDLRELSRAEEATKVETRIRAKHGNKLEKETLKGIFKK